MKHPLSAALALAGLLLATTSPAATNPVSFRAAEDLCYQEFILPVYPDGLRAAWGGPHADYLDGHTNDAEALGVNINHEVSTESASLLAHVAALRGDQAVFEAMFDLWTNEQHFLSGRYQLAHWILDADGSKYSSDGNYANAPGEEIRMIEALKTAAGRFTPSGGRDYGDLADRLAEGLAGVGGGQGNFEPLSTGHRFVHSTAAGDGGVDDLLFAATTARHVRINGLERNTGYGYSLWEVEIYGPASGTNNLALSGAASASSEQDDYGTVYRARYANDGLAGTRWASDWSDPQHLEIDLEAPCVIDRIVLRWEYASAKTYNVDLNPLSADPVGDGYLLRPWFVWLPADGDPVSTPDDPTRLPLNYNNLAAYHHAAGWLVDDHYRNVLDHTLALMLGAQNTNPASPARGLFRNYYDLASRQYSTDGHSNVCATLYQLDIAIRLADYGRLATNSAALQAGMSFLDFARGRYLGDGVLWASFHGETGEPEDAWTGLELYAGMAQLALACADFDLAEKILREQILPLQVDDPSDPGYAEGYRGAFKPRANLAQCRLDIWKDASAFVNLEVLKALCRWNAADTESWSSRYPDDWTTVAAVTDGDGGEDLVSFALANARYVRILCTERALPAYGYSLYAIEAFGPDGTNRASGRPVSVSSVQNVACVAPCATDGSYTTRWSSEFGVDPQWLYVDLGTNCHLQRVRLLWEAASARSYQVQLGQLGPVVIDSVAVTRADWSAKTRRLTVEATSSAAPSAALATAGLGPLSYHAPSGAYRATYRNIGNPPASVTVTSSSGGAGTRPVAFLP